jgi:hypothetical protein
LKEAAVHGVQLLAGAGDEPVVVHAGLMNELPGQMDS